MILVWHAWDVTSTAQTWVADPDDNHGLALITEGADISLYIGGQFRSSDYTSDPTKRPRLTITYHVDPLVTIHYDALSRPDTIWFANGVTEINTYDANRNWLTKREYKRGSTNIYTFNSSGSGDFDKVGNLKNVVYTHKSDAAKTMEYGYDVHNRLVEFKHEGNVLRDYEYDPNGNITDFDGNPFRYSYSNNQLSYAHGDSFRYDASGRATWIDTGAASVTLTYDIFSNMTGYGSGNEYTYDVANQRLRKTESGDSTYYVTNGLEVLAEYDENDNLQAEHIYGLGRMLAKFEPGVGHKFFYTDHLGSTRLAGGSSESADDMRRDYYPYGEALTAAGNDDTPYTFTQKELDSATGLHYFGARYYDPRVGRWYVPDPLDEFHSPYVFVGNNPINLIDRTGLATYIDSTGNVLYVDDKGTEIYQLNVGKDYAGEFSPEVGTFVGHTLHIASFADQQLFHDTGELVAAKGAKIDLNSAWARATIFNRLREVGPGVLGFLKDYVPEAIRGTMDIKHEAPSIYYGSQLDDGLYVSARDAGNILAGAVARGSLSQNFALSGFGAVQMGKNELLNAMLVFIRHAGDLSGVKYFGENRVSHEMQKWGYERFWREIVYNLK